MNLEINGPPGGDGLSTRQNRMLEKVPEALLTTSSGPKPGA